MPTGLQMATISASSHGFPSLCVPTSLVDRPFIRTPVILNEGSNPMTSFNPSYLFTKALSPNIVASSVLGVRT